MKSDESRKARLPTSVNKISQNLSRLPRYMQTARDLLLFLSSMKGLARAHPSAWLCVEGPDAASFLQGQCTQELRRLLPWQTADALWLSHKGRIVAETLVIRAEGDRWWLWSAHSDGEALRTRLEDFIIADDVTVQARASDWEQLTLSGEAAEIWLRDQLQERAPPSAGTAVHLGGGLLFTGRRGLPRTWDWLRPLRQSPPGAGATSPEPPAALGELSPIALHRARLAAGVPAIPAEFGPQDLPQEAALEELAVSFTKGCYLGQEVMARLHAMGQVRRRLLRVAGPGSAPAAGLELRQNDKRCGELRATVDDGREGWFGLAIVNLLGLDPAALLTTADQRPLRLLDPLPR